MTDNVFDYIDSKLDPAPFVPSPELVASVDAYLAALKQPRVYFEHTQNGFYKLAYDTRIAYVLPAFIDMDIEYESTYKEPTDEWMDKLTSREWEALSDANNGYNLGDEWWDWE